MYKLSELIAAGPELFFRLVRGIAAIIVVLIPAYAAYDSITSARSAKSVSPSGHTPSKPDQHSSSATPNSKSFDVDAYLRSNTSPTNEKTVDELSDLGAIPSSGESFFERDDIVPTPAKPINADELDALAPSTGGKPKLPPLLELPLPPSGHIQSYTRAPHVAPFEIKPATGTNYFVKLSDRGSGETVLTVFVRAGSPVKISVPLGSYTIKYAAGDKWYGETHLFGPSTSYSKANETFTFRNTGEGYSGYSITLYNVSNGNLQTERIKPDQF